MYAHVSLLGIAGLPLAAGLIVLVCAPWWHRWFGAERATAMAGRFGLGGALLAMFLVAAAVYALQVRPDLPPIQPVSWAQVGFTTVLRLDLVIDGLTLLIAGMGFVVGLVAMLAAIVDAQRGAVALGRTAALLGATLLIALADSVWAAVVGWQVAMLVAGSCSTGQVPEDRWARLTDAGAWLAVLALAVGVGDLGVELLNRGGMLGEHAHLVTTGLAPVAAVGLIVAVLGRALGFVDIVRGQSAATRVALHGLAGTAGVLLLLRLHMALVMAPTVMAGLAIVGGGLAAVAGWLGVRATEHEERLGRVTQAVLGLLLVAVAMGAWAPACGLVVGHALAVGGLVLGGRAGRWIAGLSLGLAPVGAGLWIGEVAGAGFVYLSAWSSAINFVVAGLVTLAMVGLGGVLGAVLRDRSEIAEGLHAGLGVALAALGIAAASLDVPRVTTLLRDGLGQTFLVSGMLDGQYAIGARPGYAPEAARLGAVVTVLAAWAGFLWLRRGPAWAVGVSLARWRRGWLALCRGLHKILEGQVVGLMLRPGAAQAGREDGPPQATRALVGLLAGALALLATVYCNADVVHLGPSRTYPVDAGGLDAALLGSRRPGAEAE